MQDYQIRVVKEAGELAVKIRKLSSFLFMQDMHAIDTEERLLLKQQLVAMIQYNIILDQRIAKYNTGVNYANYT